MLSLLLLLLGLIRLAAFSSPHSQLYITVPYWVENDGNGQARGPQMTYIIDIDQKSYTLHLKKQPDLDQDFQAYSYKSGKLHAHSSLLKDHCFYEGYAAERPKSVVVLNACAGLRGMIQFENVSYVIESLEYIPTYVHMLYQIKNNIPHSSSPASYVVPPAPPESYRTSMKQEKQPLDELSTRTLKIQIILDKGLYEYMGSDMTLAAEKIVFIFHLMNTMFSQLKMKILLSSLEAWSDQNKISTNEDADDILQRFLSWKQNVLFQRSHDMAYLLIYKAHPVNVGATYHGMACNPKFSAGIALYSKTITIEAFSVILVQLIAINLGLTYDNIYNCHCPGTTCIMNPDAIYSIGTKYFSSCSVNEFKQIVSQPEFECLLDKTVSKVVYEAQSASCGNGIVESAEQCDCGVEQICKHKKCCKPKECVLIGDAMCGSGPCCDPQTCTIMERGKLCRRSIDQCDFPEFCNGTSEFCVPDAKADDFEACNNNTAYCYRGRCRDTDVFCEEIHGKFAQGGIDLCSMEINFQNDDFGNCQGRGCSFSDVICGKVVCEWKSAEVIKTSTHIYNVQYTYLKGHVCVSAQFRVPAPPGASDRSQAPDGLKCEDARFCLRGTCRAVAEYANKTLCNSAIKCQGHGVCNNFFNCHCDVGYAPPYCDQTPSSPGGSIDDGFWYSTDKMTPLEPKQRRRASPKKKGLLVSLFVSLPFFVLTAIFALKWNKMKHRWYKAGTISENSISEDSSENSNQSYSEASSTAS
ncbi:A disintegrin and metallopeptidase domain 3-like isoform X1 [Cavia porcellus]|uniref:A disintegrin and metallopeptidase domain 3-like isoform X1 n=1 Tax=Cavia porcellus TaxID=10141 RepID=UPI000661F6E5|nr:A disintegrin and metallopeptidase domain 3-like isoform X1 [Cavia porcellus]